METKVIKFAKFLRNNISKIFVTAFIKAVVAIIITILWIIFNDLGIFEPISVLLYFLSGALFSSKAIANHFDPPPKKLSDMSKNEILEFVAMTNSIFDWETSEDNEFDKSIYKNDPKLKLYSHNINDKLNDNFVETWANKFPDPKASSFHYHLSYNNNTIESFILVYVDGFRCLIPLPKFNVLTITKLQYTIALIFDRQNNLDSYLQRAEIKIVE